MQGKRHSYLVVGTAMQTCRNLLITNLELNQTRVQVNILTLRFKNK